jgi:O-succinylbenzoic acid--CoA ligase
MPRTLVVVPDDPGAVLAELREALAGGPAILPLPEGADRTGLPREVAQNVALVVQTSGSTGAPKRVALSADALLASAAASEGALGGPGQWLLALPVHYIAGINELVRSIAAETDPVVLSSGHFDPATFVEAAATMDHPARYTSLVPAQLATLLDDADARAVLRDFQAVLVGGQATPAPLLERAREGGIRVVRSYGSSETSGGCVYDGRPIGGARVRIVDGEVQLGGTTVADGYLDDPRLTEERFTNDGGIRWFRTADAGEFDGETLRVLGRRDDVIISGGVKVSLARIEEVVRAQPGCADAVVVAVAHPRWGERPVVVAAGAAVDDPAVLVAVEARLGSVAKPDGVVRVAALPLLPSGKPDRRAAAALARTHSAG